MKGKNIKSKIKLTVVAFAICLQVRADIVVVHRVDCEPEFTIYMPSKSILAFMLNEEMQGGLWKYKSIGGYCFRVDNDPRKRLSKLILFAISKPRHLSKALCAMSGFDTEIDTSHRKPRFVDKENVQKIAAEPCADISVDNTVEVPKEINDHELAGLANVLESFISKVNEKDSAIHFEDRTTEIETTGISLRDVFEIKNLKRNPVTGSVEEFELSFHLRTARNANTIGKAIFKIKSWEIVEVYVSNAHWDDLI